MRLAFYAPMKSPHHPVPSGDRTIARGVLAALAHGGHQADLASDLRIYDKSGDAAVQEDLAQQAAVEVARILDADDAQHWAAWITYHNYYKAPDLIGPDVCQALDIPYFLIEATRAQKRLNGPWATFAARAEAACDQAQTIFYFTKQDAEALRRDAPDGQSVRALLPFLQTVTLPHQSPLDGPILVVGMMRAGDKMASYALVAETLALLPDMDWSCDILGDGPARAEVAALFARFGPRVRFLGSVPPEEMAQHYTRASMLLWPGVNEAFGMIYLEAQAAGLPIVAQDRPGVCDVVPAPRLPVSAGPPALAKRVEDLLRSKPMRLREGTANRERIAAQHLLPAAAQSLSQALEAM